MPDSACKAGGARRETYGMKFAVFLQLLLNISKLVAVTDGHESCRSAGSISDYVLRGHVINTFNDKTLESCVFTCDSDEECLSVNYYHVTGTCEVNTRSRETNPCNMTAHNGGLYISSLRRHGNSACAFHNCRNNVTCIVTSYCPGFKCLCGQFFKGRQCEDCTHLGQPLGMENGIIPNDAITASSYEPSNPPFSGRRGDKGWIALSNDTSNPYFQVQFARERLVSRVSIQGNAGKNPGEGECIQRLYFSRSFDGKTWLDYTQEGKKEFIGCRTQPDKEVIIKFNNTIRARFIRIIPTKFLRRPALKIELYGCEAFP